MKRKNKKRKLKTVLLCIGILLSSIAGNLVALSKAIMDNPMLTLSTKYSILGFGLVIAISLLVIFCIIYLVRSFFTKKQ